MAYGSFNAGGGAGGGGSSASAVIYDNTNSGLTAETAQAAIDELAAMRPRIIVTTEESSVTCTDGTTTLTEATVNGRAEFTVPGYGSWTVDDGTNAAHVDVSDVKKYFVHLSGSRVYGVEWDYSNPSTALSRLSPYNDPNGYVTEEITSEPVPAVGTGSGSSPFDNCMPWAGMVEVNIGANGVEYYQGEAGFSRTANDTLVYIPAFYYAIVDDAENQRRQFYISDGPRDGFQKHPGSGRYVARYNTGFVGNSEWEDISELTFISKSGQAPLANITRDNGREGSRNKGTKWAQYDFATYCAIGLLFTVEFADWDSDIVGPGITEGYLQEVQVTGLTDSMTYHTGRAAPHTSETDEYACQIQYRHIEGLWGNMTQWVDGINFSDRAAYVCTDPANFADDTDVNYTDTGVTLPSSGFIKGLGVSTSAPWALIPNANGGSASTYIPDRVNSNTGWRTLNVGGYCVTSLGYAGLWYFNGSFTSTNANASRGSRLLYIP